MKQTWKEYTPFPVRRDVRMTEEQESRLVALARRWQVSAPEAVRRLIDDRYVSEISSNSGGSTVQSFDSAA